MKFNLVNNDKLQIIITKDDLTSRDLNRWDLTPHNPAAQRLFQEILEEAHEECGFDVGMDAQLMVEAYPMTGESMLITVTKLQAGQEGRGFPFGMNMESIGQALMRELEQDVEEIPELDTGEAVYAFEELEHAIAVSVPLQAFYLGESQLLRYREKYFLVLQEEDYLLPEGHTLLMEYAVKDHRPGAFFREHGEVIIAEEALEILGEI